MQATQATEVGAIFQDVPIAVVWPQNQSNIKNTSLEEKLCDERPATSQVSAAHLSIQRQEVLNIGR
jgi:hypothetical protein